MAHSDILTEITTKGSISKELNEQLKTVCLEFANIFKS
jgi:hypothetical protein